MSSARPKGYMDNWTPSPEKAEIIRQVQSVIAASSYEISVRFIFYRLVGNFGYPKTERDYKNLAELLVKARRARLIPFGAISDSDPALAGGAGGFNSRAQFLRYRAGVDGFGLDPLIGQPYEIELWSEDAGSVPMLAGIARDYPVTIYSTGGFSSVTVTHAIAERVMGREVPTIFLHIGDFDPSGESIFKSMCQDVGAFLWDELACEYDDDTGETFHSPDDAGPDFRPIRVALTREQAEGWNLETAPPKPSDSRSANWVGETVQVQAMSEDQMREVVTGALDDHMDHRALAELREREDAERDEMAPLVQRAMEGVIAELGES